MNTAVMQTNLPYPVRRGKVRDIYDLGKQLVIISTDRISAFDWVCPNGIPDKGKVLNSISDFWFHLLDQPHHCISTVPEFIAGRMSNAVVTADELAGRAMLVKKTRVVPIECVVRGYLDGSGWKGNINYTVKLR
jgi:phosphoribosylaminoimidazole-succinocarboxamide synthase